MSEVLLTIEGKPVYISYQEHVTWTAGMTVDADGSPRAYGPSGTEPLDYLANAGEPGNWWGIATHNQEADGTPIVQGSKDPWPGYYVSTTAYIIKEFQHSDPRHYLDSETIPFVVVPGNVRKATDGVCKGCRARVTDKQTRSVLDCVIGDIGPSDHMGEASIAVAKYFDLNADPKTGGSDDLDRFFYEMWPGLAAEGYVLQS